MAPFRILVSDKLSAKGLAVFENAGPDIELDNRPGLGKTPDELLSIIGDYDALAIRSGTKVTPEVLEAATKLKVIGRAGIGVDNINLSVASQKGVLVMNTPDGNVVTTAEHAISLMCALTRKIPQATASMKAGKWEKSKFQGREMFNKTLGIIGLGNIGKIVASRARGLHMKVVAADPFVTAQKAQELGVELVDVDTLLSRADIVTLHVPLLDSTKNLINGAAIDKMKQGALLINAARGGLCDESAVAEAVSSGRLGGAAFDVFEKEPPDADNPLLTVDNIIATPHLGASTSEAQDNVAVSVAEQIIDYLRTQTVKNAVNAPSVPADVMAAISPYIHLGRCLGSVAAQLHDGGVENVRLSYAGETSEQRVGPISVAILASLLKTRLGKIVNDVNAPVLAKERGIEYVEEKSSAAHDFVATVGVTLEGDGHTTKVVGAIFGAGSPRIVSVNDLEVEIVPQGNLLITEHRDRPGVIGGIGTKLGEAGINISRMALGVPDGDEALARAVISVDSDVTDEVLESVRGIDGIESVHTLCV